MADTDSTSLAPKASSSSLNPKTSYRVTRTIHFEDISSKFDDLEVVRSEGFFSQHDPHSIVFHLSIEFGSEEKDCLSAFIYSTSQNVNITLFNIFAYNDERILVESAEYDRFTMVPGEEYGPRRLLTKEQATASTSWRIIFEFEYEAVTMRITESTTSSYSDTRLQNDYRQVLDSERDSDVIFLVKGEKIKAHKIILTTRCEYFVSMFNSGMAESAAKEIVVTDVEPAVFRQLLSFIYAGVTPAWSSVLTSDEAMVLLAVSDKYGVDDLKKYCETTLCSHLNADNVIDALLLAESHDCSALMATAMSVFGSYVGELKRRNRLDELTPSPSLLVKLLEHCHGHG